MNKSVNNCFVKKHRSFFSLCNACRIFTSSILSPFTSLILITPLIHIILGISHHHILWITILTIHNSSLTFEAYNSSASEFLWSQTFL